MRSRGRTISPIDAYQGPQLQNKHIIYFHSTVSQPRPLHLRAPFETAGESHLASNLPHTIWSDCVRSQPIVTIARAPSHFWFIILKHKRMRLVESFIPILIRGTSRVSPHKIGQACAFSAHHWHTGSTDGPLCKQHATQNVILSLF